MFKVGDKVLRLCICCEDLPIGTITEVKDKEVYKVVGVNDIGNYQESYYPKKVLQLANSHILKKRLGLINE